MTKPTHHYKKTFEGLEQVASKFWPSELSEIEANLSVIPLLISTQAQFISIISIDTPELENLFDIVGVSSLPANLFLKHLVILADFSGEMLSRVSNNFTNLFPQGRLNYLWKGMQKSYTFKALPQKNLLTIHLELMVKN